MLRDKLFQLMVFYSDVQESQQDNQLEL